MNAARWLVAGILAGVLVLLILFGYGLAKQREGDTLEQGARIVSVGGDVPIKPHPAPDFTLKGFDGKQVKLSDYKGKVVIVNFWASWCPPCAEEAPTLESGWQKFKNEGVVFLGVNLWDDPQNAEQFIEDNDLTYINGTTKTGTATEYGLTGIPETYVIDKNGQVIRRWRGPLTDHELANLVEAGLSSR